MAGVSTVDIDSLRREIDVAKKIALLEPDATPLTVILMRARKAVTTDPLFYWWEDELGPRWDAINCQAGYDNDDTDLVVENGAYFRVKDIVKVPRTGECMLVTAITTNTLTVTRGYGTTAAAALVDNDPLLILANAMEEGSSAPTERTGQPTKEHNYCQIIRTPFSVTGTTNRAKQVTGPERQRLRAKAAIEHRLDIERAVLFGERKEDTSGDKPRRTMGGLFSFLTANVYDAGGTLTEAEFETSFCEVLFRYGTKRKLLVCAPRVVSVINQWAAGRLQTEPKEKVYGLSIQRYISAHGELYIVSSNLLEGAIYGGMALGLDMENITYRPLTGGDTRFKPSIQPNDEDSVRDEFFTEAGLEVKLPKTHAILKNVTG